MSGRPNNQMQRTSAAQAMDAAIAALNRWRLWEAATVWYSLPLAEGVK
jgi:hypothetical protein